MKKIYILFITILSLHSFAQKDNSRYYNSWRLGLNLGGAWQTADYRSCWGMAGGFTLEKGLGENSTNFFSFAIRGRYLAANTYGMDFNRNYNIKDNYAYNGKNDVKVNYVDSMPANRRYVYDNYKMTLGEGSLELQLTFNRLRERTGVLLNIWGGVGFTSYRTKSDLLDADGKMYNFSQLDSTGSQSSVINKYNSIIDKKYESNAHGSKNGNLITFSPSLGIGLGYQFSPGFSMLWEYKLTLPQGANADLLDGRFGNNNDAIGGNNDYYHYTGLNLVFTLRGKHKNNTVNETTYTNTVVPTQSVTPTNTVVVVPTQSITPTNTVVVTPPAGEKPIVSFVMPSSSGQTTNSSIYRVSATVLNVTSVSQIQFKFNGINHSGFTFNAQSHILEYDATLQNGNNIFQITATNTAGTNSKTSVIIFEHPKPAGVPPTVSITNPAVCPTSYKINQFAMSAIVTNVNLASDIVVKLNNTLVTNFTYNSANGQVNALLNMVNGNNTIEVKASNNYGSDSKTCVIECTKLAQTTEPPVVTFITPLQSGNVSVTQTYMVKAQILNINNQNDATITLNGTPVAFTYNAATKQVLFTANLRNGSNPVVISASNAGGSDTKTTDIVYSERKISTGKAPIVNLVNPALINNSTDNAATALKLSVLNVSSNNEIKVSINGNNISNFTYNATNQDLDFSTNLVLGNNIIVVNGTNQYGSDSKTIYIMYTPKVEMKTPPSVIITNPANPMATAASSSYVFKAIITNVGSAAGLTVKLNGVAVTNFTYDGHNLNFPTTLSSGNNTFEVKATNNDGTDVKSVNINYKAKIVSIPPVVSLINPALPNNATDNSSISFKLSVINVNSKNDIELTFNGAVQPNFTYNTTTKEVDYVTNLAEGNNTIVVKGTNSFGVDSKQINVTYTPKIALKTPPIVTIANPVNSGSTVQSANYIFRATLTNIPTNNGIAVKFNGNVVTNFTYDGFNLNYPATLVSGNNTIEIVANNNDGSDLKTASVNYKAKVVGVPPIVNLINPSMPDNATDNSNIVMKLSVINVTSGNDIGVMFNNVPFTNFTYDVNTKEVNFSNSLISGNNTIVVKGTNAFGTDSKQINITYTPKVEVKLPPVINFIRPNSSSSNIQAPNYLFRATITNVSTTAGLVVKLNGNVVTNFTYDGLTLSCNQPMNIGNNTFEITANNNDGTDTKNVSVNYTPKPKPPVVTILNPVNTPTVTTGAYDFQFKVMNATQSQIEVLLNGNAITQYNFVNNTGTFTAELKEDENSLSVKATNNDGTITKTENIIYNRSRFGNVETTTMVICHTPPGNSGASETITIPLNAWPAHQAHGDVAGACPKNDSGNNNNNNNNNDNNNKPKVNPRANPRTQTPGTTAPKDSTNTPKSPR